MTLYNPHLVPRDQLVAGFVARQPLLDELVDDLRRGGNQHHLLIGARGTGKTTLLLRLAIAIEDDAELARRCIPLRFPEEQYNVSRPSDLWMNAIDALVDALERQGDRRSAQRLEAVLAELEPVDEPERARRSLAALETWIEQAKRLIVLLVDNLDLVLDRLADSLWELRETLSLDNGLVLVGAASRFMAEIVDYQSAFYDFFHVHELGPLSEAEARTLVLALAARAGTPRVAEVLDRDPGRFKALYMLTGGTPRTIALLHTVLALDQSDRVERDLDGLLDQLTPYYKARFDDLPAQSQVIIDKVALHWHPITAAECQATTRLDINVVSAQLSRLVKSGVITKVELSGPGRLGFQITERFFNIWYLMRASRRLRRRLAWFVEFLRVFYGEEDLRRRAEDLVRDLPASAQDDPARLLAFASAVPDPDLRSRLEFRAAALLAEQEVSKVREWLDLEGDDRHMAPIVDRVRTLHEVRDLAAVVIRGPGSTATEWSPDRNRETFVEEMISNPILPMSIKRRFASLLPFWRPQLEDPPYPTPIVPLELTLMFGPRLLAAIATGEAPALPDVSSCNEIRQVLRLAEAREETARRLLLSAEIWDTPLSEDCLRCLLQESPAVAQDVLRAASFAVEHHRWPRCRQLLRVWLQTRSGGGGFTEFLDVARRCVLDGFAREAADLLSELGFAERWAPLHEALVTAADGDKRRLAELAPEMRRVAEQVYDALCAPLDGSHAESPVTAIRAGESQARSTRSRRTRSKAPAAAPALTVAAARDAPTEVSPYSTPAIRPARKLRSQNAPAVSPSPPRRPRPRPRATRPGSR